MFITYNQWHEWAEKHPYPNRLPIAHPLRPKSLLGYINRGQFTPMFAESIYRREVVDLGLAYRVPILRNDISSQAGIIAGRGAGNGEDPMYLKTTAIGGVTSSWYSHFQSAGSPAAISPSAGSGTPGAGGNVCNDTTTGFLRWGVRPGTGTRKYLLSVGVQVSNANHGLVCLVDVLQATGSIPTTGTSANVNSVAIDRAGGAGTAGVLPLLIITTNLGTGTNNYTLTYTGNVNGAGQTTPAVAMTASINAPRVLPTAAATWPFLGLAPGDTGVTSVQTFNIATAGQSAGAISILLVRPVALFPTIAATTWVELDFSQRLIGLYELVKDGSNNSGALGFLSYTSGTGTSTIAAQFRTVVG